MPIIRRNVAMEERPRQHVFDGYSWRWCMQRKVHKSVQAGSFFEKSMLTLHLGMSCRQCQMVSGYVKCVPPGYYMQALNIVRRCCQYNCSGR